MNLIRFRTLLLLVSSVFGNFEAAAASELPCDLKFGVDVGDGEVLPNGAVVKDNITYSKDNQVQLSNGVKIGCVCRLKPCLRKCCPLGDYLVLTTNETKCEFTDAVFAVPNGTGPNSGHLVSGPSLETFHVVNGFECEGEKRQGVLDRRHKDKLGEFVVQNDGTIFLPDKNERFNQMEYCVDYVNDQDEIKVLVCAESLKPPPTNTIGIIISMPFLLATFLVYALLPERNLHAKSLMCYVMTLFCAYFLLLVMQQHSSAFGTSACKATGIICQFLFMVSFFYMNVISIDIWWTFSGASGFLGPAETERKRFLLYSGYAWGVPFLLLLIVTYLTFDPSVPKNAWYAPGIANGRCWFDGKIPALLYFFGPIALLITINTFFFILTAWQIKKIQQDTADMLRRDESQRHNYENDKQRFKLYLKLMMAMGVNWLFEIMSWLVNWQVGDKNVPEYVWYVTDFLNAAYGVFIFFIFVFKKSIWRALQKRFHLVVGKLNLAKTTIIMTDFASSNAAGAAPSTVVTSNVQITNQVA